MRKFLHDHRLLLLMMLLLIAVAAGCSKPQASAADTPAAQEQTVTVPTPEPPTAVPVKGKLILTAPADAADPDYQALKAKAQELAGQATLEFVESPAFNPDEIQPDWQVVVLYGSNDRLPDALAAHPQTQFIVVTDTELNPGANLSIIQQQPEQLYFIGGMITAMTAPDWRSVGVFPPDEHTGSRDSAAFTAGAKYFCGICTSYFAPMTRFPLIVRAPKATDPAAWFDLDNTIQSSVVYMAFVASGSYSPELAAHLAQRNMIIAGNVARPSPEVTQRWAATVQFDSAAALEEIWSGVSAGNGGQVANANIKVVDSNPELFPESRMRLVDEALADLKAGLLLPQIVPGD